VLEIHAQRECQLEIWEVEKQKKYFKKMFGYSLQSKVIIKQDPGVPLVREGNTELKGIPGFEVSSKS